MIAITTKSSMSVKPFLFIFFTYKFSNKFSEPIENPNKLLKSSMAINHPLLFIIPSAVFKIQAKLCGLGIKPVERNTTRIVRVESTQNSSRSPLCYQIILF